MTRGRNAFKRYQKIIASLVIFVSVFPRPVRQALFNVARMLNGKIGLAVRYVLLKSLAADCGTNVSIHPGVFIFFPERLALGSNVSVHPLCYIDAAGGIEVGDDVSIAHASTIMSSDHNYASPDLNIKDQGVTLRKTVIKSNVWIGAGSRVLGGSIVSEGAILAAGCVFKGESEKDLIYGGIPGKPIKSRFE